MLSLPLLAPGCGGGDSTATPPSQELTMPVQLINPEKLFKPDVYRQVAIGTGTRHVHVAGQVAYDAQGQIVSRGDLAGQVAQAYRNVGTALAAVGATFKDVVRLTVYMVDWKVEKTADFLAGVEQAGKDFDLALAPVSLIGVAALYEPGILVEVEATAVLA
jgi:YD repeat-containing protein